MKKLLKSLMLVFVGVFALVGLASCSNVSQSYADKVNDAAKNNEALTLEEVCDDLDDEAKLVFPVVGGFVVAIDGVDLSDIKNISEIKTSDYIGKDYIVITIAGDKAIAAVFGTIEENTQLGK